MALDKIAGTFVVYVAALSALAMQVYPSCQAQLGLLLADKALVKGLFGYSYYTDVFSFDLIIELFKNISMNESAIELVKGMQSLYRLIYSLIPVKLETLKTYIMTYLITGFIWLFNSLIRVHILFNQ